MLRRLAADAGLRLQQDNRSTGTPLGEPHPYFFFR